MIFTKHGGVRLTDHELNTVRTRAAQNGEVVSDVNTQQDLLGAVIAGLPADTAADLLEFLETGTSQNSVEGQKEK